MPKFRNKPIEIEAYQLTEDLIKSVVLDGLSVPGLCKMRSSSQLERREVYSSKFTVTTIQGKETVVVVGDWIITEPDGKSHYPCKPDIFAARYEPA